MILRISITSSYILSRVAFHQNAQTNDPSSPPTAKSLTLVGLHVCGSLSRLLWLTAKTLSVFDLQPLGWTWNAPWGNMIPVQQPDSLTLSQPRSVAFI